MAKCRMYRQNQWISRLYTIIITISVLQILRYLILTIPLSNKHNCLHPDSKIYTLKHYASVFYVCFIWLPLHICQCFYTVDNKEE